MTTERLHWRNDIDYLEKRLAAEQAEVTRLKAALAKAQKDQDDYKHDYAMMTEQFIHRGRDLREVVALLARSQGINVTNGPLWRNQRDAFLARHTK